MPPGHRFWNVIIMRTAITAVCSNWRLFYSFFRPLNHITDEYFFNRTISRFYGANSRVRFSFKTGTELSKTWRSFASLSTTAAGAPLPTICRRCNNARGWCTGPSSCSSTTWRAATLLLKCSCISHCEYIFTAKKSHIFSLDPIRVGRNNGAIFPYIFVLLVSSLFSSYIHVGCHDYVPSDRTQSNYVTFLLQRYWMPMDEKKTYNSDRIAIIIRKVLTDWLEYFHYLFHMNISFQ